MKDSSTFSCKIQQVNWRKALVVASISKMEMAAYSLEIIMVEENLDIASFVLETVAEATEVSAGMDKTIAGVVNS